MISPDTGRKRILIVEDEPAICQLCQIVLTEEGFEVDTTANGRAAQSIMRKREYALYLVDIRLPVMDGKVFYKWLQDEYPHSAARVVFTTGDRSQVTESFLKSSGRPVLFKPFTTEEFNTIITQTLKAVDK